MLRPHALTCRGTTSACAENTVRWQIQHGIWRNYLRVRGEYERRGGMTIEQWELPPRARRIRLRCARRQPRRRTTSACAENTDFGAGASLATRNYLRVRGEYYRYSRVQSRSSELPPRARRIPVTVPAEHMRRGTTSACAENTCQAPTLLAGLQNYLRVRGEYLIWKPYVRNRRELPPRARRIQ